MVVGNSVVGTYIGAAAVAVGTQPTTMCVDSIAATTEFWARAGGYMDRTLCI